MSPSGNIETHRERERERKRENEREIEIEHVLEWRDP
jgi:hypothetical protein